MRKKLVYLNWNGFEVTERKLCDNFKLIANSHVFLRIGWPTWKLILLTQISIYLTFAKTVEKPARKRIWRQRLNSMVLSCCQNVWNYFTFFNFQIPSLMTCRSRFQPISLWFRKNLAFFHGASVDSNLAACLFHSCLSKIFARCSSLHSFVCLRPQ